MCKNKIIINGNVPKFSWKSYSYYWKGRYNLNSLDQMGAEELRAIIAVQKVIQIFVLIVLN